MNVFWQTPEPLTVSQLSRLLVGQDWSKNYIHKVLRWLSDKEFIKVVGIAQEGRYQAQQYVPTLTKDEYLAYMLEEQGVNNSLFARIAVTLFKKDKKQRTPEQDEKLIAELEKMVDEYEAQIEEKSKGNLTLICKIRSYFILSSLFTCCAPPTLQSTCHKVPSSRKEALPVQGGQPRYCHSVLQALAHPTVVFL